MAAGSLIHTQTSHSKDTVPNSPERLSVPSPFSSTSAPGRRPLPPILNGNGDGVDISKNPFLMPPEKEIFTLREREKIKTREEKDQQKQLRVHEKTTHASRMNALTANRRKEIVTPESPEVTVKDTSHLDDSDFVLATTKDRHIEKEDLAKYVCRKREMFLVQYSLGVKREEIRKLEEIARAEEKKLLEAEKYLEESASLFDDFLKENDKNSVEAIKQAETATKIKLERVAEIKRLNAQIMSVRSEISRNEEHLQELKTYQEFLYSVSPQEWHPKEKPKKEVQKSVGIHLEESSDEETPHPNRKMDKEPDEEEYELYFKDPRQLMEIFSELEEQNLSLIQNSQETEEGLEEVKQNRQLVQQKMERETQALKRQIQSLEAAIGIVEERAADLEIKSKLFSFGQYKAGDQEEMLQTLFRKVSEVYSKSIGGNDANLSTLQMLTSIENRLEELFETIESLPPEKVGAAEKSKEKERRMRMREEKLEQQKLYQEDRMRRALERAQADPKKRNGRKLVYRSEPPVLKRKHKDASDKKNKDEEELQYFFT